MSWELGVPADPGSVTAYRGLASDFDADALQVATPQSNERQEQVIESVREALGQLVAVHGDDASVAVAVAGHTYPELGAGNDTLSIYVTAITPEAAVDPGADPPPEE